MSGKLNAIVLLLSVALTAWASVSANQAVTWDLKNYHLYSGYSLLKKPIGYDFAPAQVQTYFNPILHVPTYLVFEALPRGVFLALLGAVQGLNIFLLFLLSKSLFQALQEPWRALLSLCCAITGFLGAANLGEIGTTFADNMVSILVLSGLVLLLRHLLRNNAPGWSPRLPVVLAGILIGTAVGLKLNTAPFALAALASFIISAALRREGARPILAFSAGMVVAFLSVYGFWGTFLYVQYGNPFFPYFNAVFRSPYFDPVNVNDTRFMPRDWQQLLFYPFYFAHRNTLACEATFRDARLAFCYVAVLIMAVVSVCRLVLRRNHRKKRDRGISHIPSLIFLVTFFVISYITWQLSFSIYRYLVPLELLAPVLLTFILMSLLRQPSYALVSSLLVNILIINSVVPPELAQSGIGPDSLKFEPPKIRGLEDTVVLMGGFEATSYVATRFPESTRFIRIRSNFTHPGRNSRLDDRIWSIVTQYGPSRTLSYFADRSEIVEGQKDLSFYGLYADAKSCIDLRSPPQNHGLLCRTLDIPAASIPSGSVRLLVTPKAVTAGKGWINYQVIGIRTSVIDVYYTLNGKPKPPLWDWRLDKNGRASFFVGTESEKGVYRVVAIRSAESNGAWIKVDAAAEIR